MASFVDEHSERHMRGARLDELPDPGHILRAATNAPQHRRQLAWQHRELGAAVRRFVLELCRDQNSGAPYRGSPDRRYEPAGRPPGPSAGSRAA